MTFQKQKRKKNVEGTYADVLRGNVREINLLELLRSHLQ